MRCTHYKTCLSFGFLIWLFNFWSQLELRSSYLFKMNNEFLSFLCFTLIWKKWLELVLLLSPNLFSIMQCGPIFQFKTILSLLVHCYNVVVFTAWLSEKLFILKISLIQKLQLPNVLSTCSVFS